MNNALPALKDLHYPKAIGLWPPAYGWWVLLALIIVGIITLSFFAIRNYKKYVFKKNLITRINDLPVHYNNPNTIIGELNILLKRYALSFYPRERIASLTGEAWLEFLAVTSGNADFLKNGQALINAAYSQHEIKHCTTLFDLAKQWVIIHCKRGAYV